MNLGGGLTPATSLILVAEHRLTATSWSWRRTRSSGSEKTGGANRAGAKYGTGYCDAQCPHDLKFMEGKANVTWLILVDLRYILGFEVLYVGYT